MTSGEARARRPSRGAPSRARLEAALYVLGLCALAGMLAIAALRPLNPARNNDVFIHLTSGRLLLEEGRIQRTDRYTFTAPDARYVPHEWGAQLLYALGERAAGIPGVIVAARLLPALAILAGLVLALRNAGAGRATCLGLATLAWAVARHRLLARPDLLGLAFLVTALWLLLRHRRLARSGRRSRAVWCLVPLELAWVNVHGSFPLGVAFTLAFAGDALLERLPHDRARALTGALGAGAAALAILVGVSQPASFAGPAMAILALAALALLVDAVRPWLARPAGAPGLPGPLFLVAGVQTLALLANPVGAGLLLFSLELGTASGQIARNVIEWRPILETLALPHWAHRFAPTGLAAAALYLSVAFVALAVAWRRGAIERLTLALLLGLALLPLRHTRWLALFALGTAPALALLLASASQPPGPVGRPGPVMLLLAAVGCLAACLATLAAVGFETTIVAPVVTLGAVSLGALWGSRAATSLAPIVMSAGGVFVLLALSVGPGIPEKVGLPWRPGLFVRPVAPVPAVAFLESTGLRGRLCTEYDWAGYAIYALWPAITVNIDSRSEVHGDTGLRDWIVAHRDREAAREQLSACELALVHTRPIRREGRRTQSALLDELVGSPRWHPIYRDPTSALFAIEREGVRLPTLEGGNDGAGDP